MKCYCAVLLTMWPWPLTFDLETTKHCCRWVDNLPTNFGVSRTFRFRLIGQHLSDASRDLATLTFNLGGHGACRWYKSSCSVCIPTLNFVWGLSVRKILGIYCVSINQPGDLELWPLKYKIVSLLGCSKFIPYTKFEHFGIIRFWVMLRSADSQTDWLENSTHHADRHSQRGLEQMNGYRQTSN